MTALLIDHPVQLGRQGTTTVRDIPGPPTGGPWVPAMLYITQ